MLIETWYAIKDLMLSIYKSGHLLDDSGEEKSYQRVEELSLSEQELEQGKLVKAKGFPKDHQVKLSRIVVSTSRTGWISTNDLSYGAMQDAQQTRTAC